MPASKYATSDVGMAGRDDADADADAEFDGLVSAAPDMDGGLMIEADDFDEQVQFAQEQLLHLRHQQQLLEKQKSEIEELKVRRREFLDGRSQLVDRLSRAVVSLERETFEAQKRAGQFLQTKDAFERHLESLEQINPDDWSRAELRAELARALGLVDDARAEYQKAMARMHAILEEDAGVPAPQVAAAVTLDADVGRPTRPTHGSDPREFGYWFRAGFAFTLPLVVFGLFALIVHLLFA
ncbi:MAG TPA: hypothetical protein VMN03_02705 [Burkholderiales bacterium]|nr:hypothetical protein [Burkholderiales bacterium]